MAVACGLPKLEEPALPELACWSTRNGRPIGLLTGNQRRICRRRGADRAGDEAGDHRDRGPPLLHERRRRPARHRAARCGRTCAPSRRVQGGSTITQQFVKTALAAQDKRTLFQKLREAALAYQLTRKWSKERILRNYLNTIYFGNGAYGIESAARTYFGQRPPRLRERQARARAPPQLELQEAALLAGIVAVAERATTRSSTRRRPSAGATWCSQRMLEQGYISRPQYDDGGRRADPDPRRRHAAAGGHGVPVLHLVGASQQVVDKLGGGQVGARQAFEGGLTVKTTIDVEAAGRRADARSTQWLPVAGRPARLDGGDRQQRPARCARWSAATTTRRSRSTSPPRASASPARRSSRSCSPRRSKRRHLARLRLGVAQADVQPQAGEHVHRQQLQRRLRRASRRSRTRRRSPTTPSTSRSASRSGPRRSPAWRARWASGRRSRATSRSRSAACTRASRRSTWRTPTRRSPTAASSSTAR